MRREGEEGEGREDEVRSWSARRRWRLNDVWCRLGPSVGRRGSGASASTFACALGGSPCSCERGGRFSSWSERAREARGRERGGESRGKKNAHERVASLFEDEVDERLDLDPRLPHALGLRVERLRPRFNERRSDDDVQELEFDLLLTGELVEHDGGVKLAHAVLVRLGLEQEAEILDGRGVWDWRVGVLGLLVAEAHLATVVKVVELLVGALRGGYDELEGRKQTETGA